MISYQATRMECLIVSNCYGQFYDQNDGRVQGPSNLREKHLPESLVYHH